MSDECHNCGADIPYAAKDRGAAVVADGGLICRECADNHPDI